MGNTRAQEAGESQKNWLFDFFFKYFLITGELLVFYAGGGKTALQRRHRLQCASFESSQMAWRHHMGLTTYFSLQW